MARPRDSQRQRVYDAEREVEDFDRPADGMDAPFSIHETRAFVRTITRSRWWRNRTRRFYWNVPVKDGRGRRNGGGTPDGYITMPRWSRTPMVICHELAHVATPANKAAHGRTYCGWYLALVRQFVSEEAYQQLRDALKRRRVKTAGMPKPL